MKPFSIYFPQFYATPTNDQAWGKGFTDWMLVAEANLHNRWERRAPRRGFYDGADPAVHHSHMEEMLAGGLGGFGLYHYWFHSHQELDAFEKTLLRSSAGAAALPWFLIWANEGWSKRWLGEPTTILALSPEPGRKMIERHCDHLVRCFNHQNYFRWQNKPLFVWYDLGHFKRPHEVIEQYRESLARVGTEIAVGQFVKNPSDTQYGPLADVSYLFEPRLYFGVQRVGRGSIAKGIFDRFKRLAGERAAARLLIMADRVQQKGTAYAATDFLRYLKSDQRARLIGSIPGAVQEVLSPGWNNAPRYAERFTALESLPPDRFGELIRLATSRSDSLPPLINAWNEWSEGAAIEPCHYYGTRYLDAIRLD